MCLGSCTEPQAVGGMPIKWRIFKLGFLVCLTAYLYVDTKKIQENSKKFPNPEKSKPPQTE